MVASSEDLLGIGPASQHVFSAGKTEALKTIFWVVILIVGLGGEDEFFLSEMGLITLLGSNATSRDVLQQPSGRTRSLCLLLLEHTIVIPKSCLLTS